MAGKGFQPRSPKSNRAKSGNETNLAPYVRTMPVVIDAMLKLADLNPADVLYDLGCGDGRILITAAQQYGVSGLGVDLDLACIHTARNQAQDLGLGDRIQFKRQDLLKLDCSAATVVTLYLLPKSNLLLRDKLRRELAPGSRILSHSFDMGDWLPDTETSAADAINTYPIYLWRV